METSKHSTGSPSGEQLTFLPEDSRASHIAGQETGRGLKMNATSGRKCVESLQRFDQVSLWVRMFVASLIGRGDWYSRKSKLRWRLSATKSHRLFFQLAVKTLHISGIEFGLLPTPAVDEFRKTKQELFITTTGTVRAKYGENKSSRVSLSQLAHSGLLPTPTYRDYRSGFQKDSIAFLARQQHSRGVNLHEYIQRIIGENFLLNPPFVEEMMGYPIGWTELRPSETPSSRKSPTKSSKQ